MTYTNKKIDRRLRTLLIYSGEKRENLACAAGVTTPVVNRWLSRRPGCVPASRYCELFWHVV